MICSLYIVFKYLFNSYLLTVKFITINENINKLTNIKIYV